jgi:regulator of protease activity HflC (stomatin/prohibitin superfamily)
MKNIFTVVAIGFAAVLGLSIPLGSWYTVDQGEVGVEVRMGKVVDVAQAGVHGKLPFLADVWTINTRTQSVPFDKLSAYTKDQQPVETKVSVTYRILGASAEAFYTTYRNEVAWKTAVLDRVVPTQVENVFGKFNAITAVQERPRLNIEIKEAIEAALGDVALVQIVSVQVENIDFDNAYEAVVAQRMQAEVEVAKLGQNLERERIQADIIRTQAQGKADGTLAQAKADAQSIVLRGDAEAQAIKARADALKQNANLVDLITAERWNGVLPTMMPGATVPMLNINRN